jgi:hypothetical protein
MGTRYEDQPPEHWAGPESLDPTPVWKQFLLIGLFLVFGLVLVGGVAVFALAPQLASPPALVVGDRLVLTSGTVRSVGAPPAEIGPPTIDEARRFWLSRVSRSEVVAFRALWSPQPGGTECPVAIGVFGSEIGYVASCEVVGGRMFSFDSSGNSRDGASRGLDRYLVSMGDDRVIVNMSRLIISPQRTSAPPTP